MACLRCKEADNGCFDLTGSRLRVRTGGAMVAGGWCAFSPAAPVWWQRLLFPVVPVVARGGGGQLRLLSLGWRRPPRGPPCVWVPWWLGMGAVAVPAALASGVQHSLGGRCGREVGAAEVVEAVAQGRGGWRVSEVGAVGAARAVEAVVWGRALWQVGEVGALAAARVAVAAMRRGHGALSVGPVRGCGGGVRAAPDAAGGAVAVVVVGGRRGPGESRALGGGTGVGGGASMGGTEGPSKAPWRAAAFAGWSVQGSGGGCGWCRWGGAGFFAAGWGGWG